MVLIVTIVVEVWLLLQVDHHVDADRGTVSELDHAVPTEDPSVARLLDREAIRTRGKVLEHVIALTVGTRELALGALQLDDRTADRPGRAIDDATLERCARSRRLGKRRRRVNRRFLVWVHHALIIGRRWRRCR